MATDFGVRFGEAEAADVRRLLAELERLVDRLRIEIDDLKRRVTALGG